MYTYNRGIRHLDFLQRRRAGGVRRRHDVGGCASETLSGARLRPYLSR